MLDDDDDDDDDRAVRKYPWHERNSSQISLRWLHVRLNSHECREFF